MVLIQACERPPFCFERCLLADFARFWSLFAVAVSSAGSFCVRAPIGWAMHSLEES